MPLNGFTPARSRMVLGRSMVAARPSRRPAHRPVVGLLPDERHPDHALVVHRALQHQLMVAHQVAVVGGEDHHRIVRPAGPFQRRKDARHRVVDHGDHAVGQRDQRPHLLLRCRRTAPAYPSSAVPSVALGEQVAHVRRHVVRIDVPGSPAAACRRRDTCPSSGPGGVNGWCGSGNEHCRKNGRSRSFAHSSIRAMVRSAM